MDIGKNLSQSFEVLKNNIGLLIGATLVAGLLGSITIGILAGPLACALFVIIFKLLRSESVEFGELFTHFDKIVPCLILLVILVAIGIGLGIVNMILAFIPILGWLVSFLIFLALAAASPLIGMVLTFTYCAMVEKNLDAIAALKYSVDLVKGDIVNNWLYALVFSLVGAAGAIACGIGMLVTLPVTYIGMVMAYNQLSNSVGTPAVSAAPSV